MAGIMPMAMEEEDELLLEDGANAAPAPGLAANAAPAPAPAANAAPAPAPVANRRLTNSQRRQRREALIIVQALEAQLDIILCNYQPLGQQSGQAVEIENIQVDQVDDQPLGQQSGRNFHGWPLKIISNALENYEGGPQTYNKWMSTSTEPMPSIDTLEECKKNIIYREGLYEPI